MSFSYRAWPAVSRLAWVVALLTTAMGCTAAPVHVREPAVAGTFYPADKVALAELVDSLLAHAAPAPEAVSVPGDLIAVISPHAGYAYSGAVAAQSYARLQGKDLDTVIVIGPSHHLPLHGISVYTEGVFRTPLGDVPINRELARSLIDEAAGVVYNPEAHAGEHSIETQIPFLQRALKKPFSLVAIAVGTPSPASFQSLTERIANAMARSNKVFLVASTDLSHYYDHRTAVDMDMRSIDPVKSLDLERLEHLLRSGEGQMCGGWPVVYALGVARRLGANQGVLFKYGTSGDVTGDTSRVVGYAAIGLYRSPWTPEERAFLHDSAVRTVREYVITGTVPEIQTDNPKLNSYHGVFVTINREGHLRGCIGSLAPARPLLEGVIQNAVNAAAHDPRFPPVGSAELDRIEVEVSVLSPFKPIEPAKAMDLVEIGRDGLYLKKSSQTGVFLPQVPVEQHWNLPTYLSQLCHKAGIADGGCWKSEGVELYTFTADLIRKE